MRRPVDFKTLAILLLLPGVAVPQPSGIVREGDRFVRDFHGIAPLGRRLRINAHGPVSVHAGVANSISYTVHLSVRARTEAEARSVMQRYNVRVSPRDGWVVLTAPGGPVISTVSVKAPRLDSLVVSTSDGAVDAGGIEGSLEVDTGAGELTVDRIGGDCRLVTGGGDIRVRAVGGELRCSSGAGKIQVGTVRGSAVLETVGGDITAEDVGGTVRAETGGGGIHIVQADGPGSHRPQYGGTGQGRRGLGRAVRVRLGRHQPKQHRRRNAGFHILGKHHGQPAGRQTGGGFIPCDRQW